MRDRKNGSTIKVTITSWVEILELTELDLKDNNLASIPPEIKYLTNLTKLELRNNELTSIPPEIGKLTKLKSLKLQYNNLTSLLH